MAPPNGDVSITRESRISVGLVAVLLALVAGGTGGWFDIRYQIKDLRRTVEQRSVTWSDLYEFAAANELIIPVHMHARAAETVED